MECCVCGREITGKHYPAGEWAEWDEVLCEECHLAEEEDDQ